MTTSRSGRVPNPASRRKDPIEIYFDYRSPKGVTLWRIRRSELLGVTFDALVSGPEWRAATCFLVQVVGDLHPGDFGFNHVVYIDGY